MSKQRFLPASFTAGANRTVRVHIASVAKAGCPKLGEGSCRASSRATDHGECIPGPDQPRARLDRRLTRPRTASVHRCETSARLLRGTLSWPIRRVPASPLSRLTHGRSHHVRRKPPLRQADQERRERVFSPRAQAPPRQKKTKKTRILFGSSLGVGRLGREKSLYRRYCCDGVGVGGASYCCRRLRTAGCSR